MKKHNLKWFTNRIGKRIFRLTDTKCCDSCQKVLTDGLIVHSKMSAQYLYDCQNEMDLYYADKKLKIEIVSFGGITLPSGIKLA